MNDDIIRLSEDIRKHHQVYEKHGVLIEAFLSGKIIQHKDSAGMWYDVERPLWLRGAEYRIKPKTPLQIPWDLIDETYNWAAKIENGTILLFKNRPIMAYGYWNPSQLGDCLGTPFVNIDPDDIPWKESLVQRPNK